MIRAQWRSCPEARGVLCGEFMSNRPERSRVIPWKYGLHCRAQLEASQERCRSEKLVEKGERRRVPGVETNRFEVELVLGGMVGCPRKLPPISRY